MNQAQRTYLKDRLVSIARAKEFAYSNTLPKVSPLTNDQKIQMIRSGEAKLKDYVRIYCELGEAFEFDTKADEVQAMDNKLKADKFSAQVNAELASAIDAAMLGSDEAALKAIQAFENWKP